MARTLCIALAAGLLSLSAEGKIWRVDNNPANAADFRTLQAAHDGAAAGDTLYVAGSASGYSTLVCAKQLFVFGPGYFLEENAGMQARPLSARTSNVEFASGSEGSLITGMDIRNPVLVWVGNITIKRNRLTNTNGFSNPLIELKSNVANVAISQNHIDNQFASALSHGIELELGIAGAIVKNNYIRASAAGGADAISMLSTSTAEISHNVIDGDLTIFNSTFHNNIQVNGAFSATACDVRHNIGHDTQFANADGNQQNVSTGALFLAAGSADGQWQLREDSPAKGAGTSGADLGMYGGATPYVLSGLPAIPVIYFFTAPSAGSPTSGLLIQIKVRSVN
jgi:hypothetical protein